MLSDPTSLQNWGNLLAAVAAPPSRILPCSLGKDAAVQWEASGSGLYGSSWMGSPLGSSPWVLVPRRAALGGTCVSG